jgi:hypothetical protein
MTYSPMIESYEVFVTKSMRKCLLLVRDLMVKSENFEFGETQNDWMKISQKINLI